MEVSFAQKLSTQKRRSQNKFQCSFVTKEPWDVPQTTNVYFPRRNEFYFPQFTDDRDVETTVIWWLITQDTKWYQQDTGSFVQRYDKCLTFGSDCVQKQLELRVDTNRHFVFILWPTPKYSHVFTREPQMITVFKYVYNTMGEVLNPSNSKCDIQSESFGTDKKVTCFVHLSLDAYNSCN